MFNILATFLEAWKNESEATQKILDSLTDESLKTKVTNEDRSLGRIAWHIITTVSEMMTRTGLTFECVAEEMPVPSSAQAIADNYRLASNNMMNAIKEQWSDDSLKEERDMYGESWTIGKTLYVLICHQIHHRGQMTVLMRQAGIKVPGIYGPSREEWSQFGMAAPTV